MSTCTRKTMAQEILHLRTNSPDKSETIGERTDNHIGHGHANKISIIFEKTRKIDCSNGTWKNIEQFSNTFSQNDDKLMNEERYDGVTAGAKWGQGHTESCIKDGDDSRTMHNFNGTVMVTELNYDKVVEANILIPNERQATDDETHEFIKYMQYVEKDYTLSKHYGTVNIIQRLLTNNSKQTIEDTKLFLLGLYHQEDHPNIEISLYNNTITSSKKPYVTITPIDLSFDGIINSKETVYAYEDTDNNEMKYFTKEQDFINLMFKYSFDITEYILNEENEKREAELFKIKATKKKGETRSGYMLYRDGRLITGKTPRKFGFKPENSPNRGKGIRFIIKIYPEHVDAADFDFKIGTNKKLTEDSFHQFNDRLKTYLETTFNKADKNKKKRKDNAIKESINSFDTARNSLNTYNSIEELDELSGKVQSQLNTVISIWGSTKSNSILCRAFEKFNTSCEKRKQEIKTQTQPQPQVEPVHIDIVKKHILTEDETIEKAVFEKVMRDFNLLVNKYDIKNENGDIIIGNGQFKIIKL